jgi:exopolysaccharide production protein ExoZ
MLSSIQYLRGIAALLVVFHHATLQLERHGNSSWFLDARIGTAGVDIFFVISGFIMMVTTSKGALSPLQFWFHRIIRIVPLYWLYTLIMIVLAITFPSLLKTAVFDPIHSLKSLFFVPVSHPTLEGQIFPILVQGWTLNYEMFFYLMFGFTLLMKNLNQRLTVLLLLFTALVTYGLWNDPTGAILITYTNTLLLEFLAGILIGYLFINNKLPTRNVGYIFVFTALLLFVVSYHFPDWISVRALEWGIPSAFLVLGLLTAEHTTKMPTSSPMLRLGDSSYSLYLAHGFVLSAFGVVWGRLNVEHALFDLAMFLVSIALSIVAGFISYLFIEKPLLRFFRNKSKRREPHPT